MLPLLATGPYGCPMSPAGSSGCCWYSNPTAICYGSPCGLCSLHSSQCYPVHRLNRRSLGFLVSPPDSSAAHKAPVKVDCFASSINVAMTPYSLSKHLSIPVYLNKAEKPRQALLDCGAMGNFIHEKVVEQLGLMRTPRNPIPLHDVKGTKIGELAFQVTTTLRIGVHEEWIIFYVAPIRVHALVLGLPWLQFHNPTINWERAQVQFNLDHCNSHCLPCPHDVFAKQDSFSHMESDIANIFTIDFMPTVTKDTLRSMIPEEYHDFLDVFNPETPLSRLPPPQPQYDFA